jgi:hypothetical protein
VVEDSSLLVCDAVSLGSWFPIFPGIVAPSFATVKQSRKNCLTLKDEDATIIRNVGNQLPNDMASQPRRLESSPQRTEIRFCIENFMLSLLFNDEHAARKGEIKLAYKIVFAKPDVKNKHDLTKNHMM